MSRTIENIDYVTLFKNTNNKMVVKEQRIKFTTTRTPQRLQLLGDEKT